MLGNPAQVAFDPLDGSSIVDANFAVGSIFGVWPDGPLVGRSGREQVAAAYAIYGPRTTLVLARCGACLPMGLS
jgi:sedoheptulose-bisphosphatase